jgi:hypothetical protein
MPHLTLKAWITIAPVLWGFFWNAVYVACPPREIFNSPRYNKFLEIVSYYGALNIRSAVMKVYGALPSEALPVPPKADPPPISPTS